MASDEERERYQQDFDREQVKRRNIADARKALAEATDKAMAEGQPS